MDVIDRLNRLRTYLLRTSASWRVAVPTILVLTALAVLGNSVGFTLFLNARLLFGSVFVILAVSLVGPLWALVPGAAAAVAAGLYWGHAVLLVPFALEALWMALLFRPSRNNAVIWSGAFWMSVGAPLSLAASILLLGVDPPAAGLFVIARILNGVLSALLAEMLIRTLPRVSWFRHHYRLDGTHNLENLLVGIMIGLILFPALILVTSQARTMERSAERVIRSEIQLTANSFVRTMEDWLQENHQSVRSLAHSARTHHTTVGDFSKLGPELEVLKYADEDFLALALFDPQGDAVHIRPDMKPPEESRTALMRTKEEILAGASVAISGIFPIERDGGTTRAVVLAAAVEDEQEDLVAIAAGILDAGSVHAHLQRTRGHRNVIVSLHDREGRLFSSSEAPRSGPAVVGHVPGEQSPVTHFGPSLQRVGDPLSTHVYTAELDGGYYRMTLPLQAYPGWHVEVLRYMDEAVNRIVQRDIAAMLLAFAVVFIVGVVAVLLSRSIVSSISALKHTSATATEKITHGTAISWPTSNIQEVAALSENFQNMSRELRSSFSDLQEAKQRAEDASLAKSRFLQNVSHELRTPLNGILGFAQLLERDEFLPEGYREPVRSIRESGNDLLRFIKDLLIHAKIDSHHLRLSPNPVDLEDSVHHVAATVQPSAEAKRLAFNVEVDERLPRVIHVDEKRLQQILYNLLSNAVAYTEHGSISLHVTSAETGQAVFAVSDTGAGIPEDEIEGLFSPLRQLERHPQYRGGTGLGLSIVKRLVVMMGGEVNVESTVGLGSTFSVKIPVDPA